MNSRDDVDPGHEEVFSLLPWYANRTLDPEKASSVSRHVRQCSECRREVRLLASLNESVRDDADDRYRALADTETALAGVMSRIDAETGPTGAKEPWAALLKRTFERMLPRSIVTPTLRWGGPALAGLLVAALGFQLYYSGEGDDYSVLSSPDLDGSSIRLSVEITPASDPEGARSVLEDALDRLERRADVHTSADGAYIVELEGDIGVDDLNDLVLDLEKEARIERVELLP